MSLFPLLFNAVLEFVARAIGQEKGMKGHSRKGRNQVSPFADNMLHYSEVPEDSTGKHRSHKHFQQSNRIQNQYTKLGSFAIQQKSENQSHLQ
jgi:hypothetical protein